MAVNYYLKRLIVETIANNINEVIIGFDNTPPTSSDGSAGRPAITLTPTVKILDNSSILVEANIPVTEKFDETLKEVYIQMKDTTGFTPVSRHVFRPVLKDDFTEMKIQILYEVS